MSYNAYPSSSNLTCWGISDPLISSMTAGTFPASALKAASVGRVKLIFSNETAVPLTVGADVAVGAAVTCGAAAVMA
ncbi:MAG: hypothetical protein M5U11_14830 [Anaerolineales bacterium]|nr:hypothetical protein [Anaerolineales bacterium]